ncbi:conserved Plasmodium protein, unknown function [Plasmodium vinckei]|uniref:Thioredoxin-like protein n=1 Tax=Plasmodium vinckei TaxID=5860 RepID=A0A6V7SHV1_PLAVN|nr:conserved Plasmodium protein, unknown function [Plasmodium vinckei]
MQNLRKVLKLNNGNIKIGNIGGLYRNYNTSKTVCANPDIKHIHNMYKLNDIYYNNLKIINNYDEYYNLVIKNEYFKDYSKMRNRFRDDQKGYNSNTSMSDDMYDNKSADSRNNTILNNIEDINNDNSSKNIISSNDLQVLYFGSYENNASIILFEKFKDIIEKNRKLQFIFLDVNVCPQGSYNCDVRYVPCVCLIYKNHIYRKKIEINYEKPIDENYLKEFLNEVQKNIDVFHSYNNKYIYSIKKQSNYLNTKYIDIDNQNIHKENWNTF